MAAIKTFVFYDSETTGLPDEELNKTKITELSLVAVKRSHILNTDPTGDVRVQLKLTLCLNPGRVVQPGSTKITGLDNDLLEHEPPFNKTVFDTINNFLNLLTKPVCLVAYNGLKFDFPILKKHLVNLNVSLSDDILCADSLYCFYDLETTLPPMSLDIQVDDSLEEITETGTTNENRPKTKDISKVKRRYFYGDDPKPLTSYKLTDVYSRLLKRVDSEAHRAENDNMMALECAVFVAKRFVQWMDNNHCLFADVQPLGF